ncbi:MAG: hypothetical protein IT458_17765 [Planctomycetes bacterium]|nr:hypothetical protein [Planctomycetota bacterium]
MSEAHPLPIDQAVAAALRECGLPPSYHDTVRQHVTSGSEEWRVCCGSGCDPCVEQIARAVVRAQALLAGGRRDDPATRA